MPNKKLLLNLGFILIVVLAILVALGLIRERQLISKKAKPATNLRFSVSGEVFRVSEEFDVAIEIATAENTVNGAELFINYDSTKLAIKNISPGNFLPEADMIEPKFYTDRVHFALLLPPGKSGVNGEGTLATITFQPLQSGLTTLSFDNQNTIVVGLGEGGQNILAQALSIDISAYNPETTLSLSSSLPNPKVGDLIDIDVLAYTGVNKISGVEFKLAYDPSSLEFVSIKPGDFLSTPDIIGPNRENNSIYYALLQDPTQEGVVGPGKIATAQFKALKPGNTAISFLPEVTIAVGMGEFGQNLIQKTSGIEFNIQPGTSSSPQPTELRGDINKDKVVDILDYIILLENFGEDPESYPGVDINLDNKVNLLDYILLFEDFGKHIQ